MPTIRHALLILVTSACATAAPGAEQAPEQVHVKAMRDPAMLSYKTVYEVLTRAQPAAARVRIDWRVVAAASGRPLPDLQMDLVGNSAKRALRVGPDGELRYGDLLDAIDAGSRAADDIVAHLLPWYLRMLGAGIDSAAICYPEPGHAVRVAGANADAVIARPAEHKVRSALTRETLYCARFRRQEAGLARDSLITPDPGWRGEY